MGTNSLPANNSKRLASMRLGKEVTGGALAGSWEADEMIAANFLLFSNKLEPLLATILGDFFVVAGDELLLLCFCTGSSVSEG